MQLRHEKHTPRKNTGSKQSSQACTPERADTEAVLTRRAQALAEKWHDKSRVHALRGKHANAVWLYSSLVPDVPPNVLRALPPSDGVRTARTRHDPEQVHSVQRSHPLRARGVLVSPRPPLRACSQAIVTNISAWVGLQFFVYGFAAWATTPARVGWAMMCFNGFVTGMKVVALKFTGKADKVSTLPLSSL